MTLFVCVMHMHLFVILFQMNLDGIEMVMIRRWC